jgi:hypothetical protein
MFRTLNSEPGTKNDSHPNAAAVRPGAWECSGWEGMRDEGVATPGGCDLLVWSRDALVAPRCMRMYRSVGRGELRRLARKWIALHRWGLRSRHRCGHESGTDGGASPAARLAPRFRLDPNAAVVRPGDAGTLSGWEGGCATRASRPQGGAGCVFGSSGAATPSSRLAGVARAEARRASHPVFAWIQTPQWSAPETRVRSPVGRGDARRGRRDPRGERDAFLVLLEPRRPRRASLGSLERRRGAPRTPFSLGSKRRSGPPRRRGYALRLGGDARRGRRDPRGERDAFLVLLEPRRPRRAPVHENAPVGSAHGKREPWGTAFRVPSSTFRVVGQRKTMDAERPFSHPSRSPQEAPSTRHHALAPSHQARGTTHKALNTEH